MHSHQTFDLEQQLGRKTPQELNKSSNLVNNNLTSLQNNGISKQTHALLRQYQQGHYGQQNDYGLDYPEISINIQECIQESQFSEEFISEFLQNKLVQNLQSKQTGRCYTDNTQQKTLAYLPQSVHSPLTYSLPQTSPSSDSNSSFNSDSPLIKEEPSDFDYFNTVNNFGPFARHDTAFLPVTTSNSTLQEKNLSRKVGRYVDKDSDEYRNKRLRNNIAVRKSREKAKQKEIEIKEKNKTLLRENDKKQKRIESLEEEVALLRNLLYTYGIPQEQLRGTEIQQ